VAEIRETGAGHQPHITRANHSDAHNLSDFPFVDLTNFTKCIEIFQRKLLLSPNSLVKPNSIRAECRLSTPAAAFRSKATRNRPTTGSLIDAASAQSRVQLQSACWRILSLLNRRAPLAFASH
jgi:hypothetical protein